LVQLGTPAWIHQGNRRRLARCAEARGLGAVSINVRITAWAEKLAVEAADNGLLAARGWPTGSRG